MKINHVMNSSFKSYSNLLESFKKKKKKIKRINFPPRSQPNLFTNWFVTGSWNQIARQIKRNKIENSCPRIETFPSTQKLPRNDQVEESGSTLRRPIAAPIIPPIEA